MGSEGAAGTEGAGGGEGTEGAGGGERTEGAGEGAGAVGVEGPGRTTGDECTSHGSIVTTIWTPSSSSEKPLRIVLM